MDEPVISTFSNCLNSKRVLTTSIGEWFLLTGKGVSVWACASAFKDNKPRAKVRMLKGCEDMGVCLPIVLI
jgi:hypothetical protein